MSGTAARAQANRRVRRSGDGGFTLVELLMALAIVATLMVVAFGGLRVVLGATQRADERIETHQHLRSLTLLLTRSVGGVFPYEGTTSKNPAPHLLFRGAESILEFVTQSPPFPLPVPVAFTAVSLTHVPGEGLVIRERALPNDEPFEEAPVVLRDASVTSLSFRYLDELNGWQKEWEEETRQPAAIEISLGLTLNGHPQTLPPLVVPLKVAVE